MFIADVDTLSAQDSIGVIFYETEVPNFLVSVIRAATNNGEAWILLTSGLLNQFKQVLVVVVPDIVDPAGSAG